MATMDAIRSEAVSKGQAALQTMDPVVLEQVVQALLEYNRIQGEIDALKIVVDKIGPVPAMPTGQVLP